MCKDTSSTPSCKYGDIVDANNQPAVDITTLRIKDTARSYWSSSADGSDVVKGGAGSHMDSYSTRNVYTYTGTFDAKKITPTTGVTSLSSSAHAVTDANTALTEAMLSVSTPAERTDLINWIRGQDVFDEDADGVTDEDRNWRFYDPIHSRPVIVTYGGTSTTPVMKLFVGTNDGVLRMVNESTGVEEWAFVAPDLLLNLAALADYTDGDHIWGLDNTPTFDIQDRSKDSSNNIVNVPDGIIDPTIGDFVHMYIWHAARGQQYLCLRRHPGLGAHQRHQQLVSSTVGLKDSPDSLQVSVEIQAGNSGGPLLDADGNVLGVLQAPLNPMAVLHATGGTLPQNVNFAAKSQQIKAFLDTCPGPVVLASRSTRTHSFDAVKDSVAQVYSGLISADFITNPKLMVGVLYVYLWDLFYRLKMFQIELYDLDKGQLLL